MTVASSVSSIRYLGNGTTATYAYPFKIFVDSDLVVVKTVISTGIETTLALTTDYTVIGAGIDVGGNVVLTAGVLASEYSLLIKRVLDIVQETVYTEGDDFPAASHEEALDYGCMVDQQLQEQIDRSLHFPEGSDIDAELPVNLSGSPLYLTVNATGDAIAGTSTLPTTTFDLNWIDVKSYGTSLDGAALTAALAANPGGGALYFGAPCTITTAITIPAGFTIVDGPYQIFSLTGAGSVAFPAGSTAYSSWFATLATAVACIGTVATRLEITKSETIPADLIIAATTDLVIPPGNILTVAVGRTLTINGSLEAGPYRIFAGTGTVTLGALIYIQYLEWSGATGIIFSSFPKMIVQVVNYQTGAVATGDVQMPYDDTIPQITEGYEFMTCTITPTNANNKLKIDVVAHLTPAVATMFIGALFQDAVANALAATCVYEATAGGFNSLKFTHYMTANTTNLITFRFRAGNQNPGLALHFNGHTIDRTLGGVLASSITITEITA